MTNNSPSGQLNVVFHGNFGFVIGDDDIEAVTPQMKKHNNHESEHEFRAGTLCKEQELQKGKYELKGVRRAQRPTIDKEDDSIIRGPLQINRGPEELFCSIRVPFPELFLLRRFMHNPEFTGTAADPPLGTRGHLEAKPKKVPEVTILTYTISDFQELGLGGGLDWEPVLNEGIVNLHIFAEANKKHPHHFDHAAEALVHLFRGLDLKPTVSETVEPARDPGIRGLGKLDMESLGERTCRGQGPYAIVLPDCYSLVLRNDWGTPTSRPNSSINPRV